MSEYPDFNYSQPNSKTDIRIDTSFTHPQSGGRDFLGESFSRDRYSRHSSQTQQRMRDVTWLSTTQSQVPSTHTHTPQTPRYMPPPAFQQVRTPTPILPRSAPTLSDSDVDAEYMTVSVDDRDACNKAHPGGIGLSDVVPSDPNGRGEKKTLVGGFVSGLRRLPKVMSRGRLKDYGGRAEQPGIHDTRGATNIGRSAVPRYQSPSSPIPKASADDIPAVERLGTPPHASVASPQRLMLSAVDEHSFEHDQSHSSDGPQTQSDLNTSISSRAFEPSLSAPVAISTPILAEPRPSADFAKMEPPVRPPPEESVASQLARIRRFFRDLDGLPWIAPRDISEVYVPGQSPSRRRYSRQKQFKPAVSWYTPRNNRPLDLLAGPSTTGLLPPQQQTPQHMNTQHPQFIIGSSSANLLFTHPPSAGVGVGTGGGSRSPTHEGPLSTDSNGSQFPPGMYAPAYVAQPLFVYPSGLPQAGSNTSPEAQMPRPVYMLASSPPQFLSASEGVFPSRTFVPQPSGLRPTV